MTLKELIDALRTHPPKQRVANGFARPHSYRGYYSELAFEPEANTTVGAMLAAAEEALGSTYTGYKGGEYTMGDHVDCYLAEEGNTGEEIGLMALKYMLSVTSQVPAFTGHLQFGNEDEGVAFEADHTGMSIFPCRLTDYGLSREESLRLLDFLVTALEPDGGEAVGASDAEREETHPGLTGATGPAGSPVGPPRAPLSEEMQSLAAPRKSLAHEADGSGRDITNARTCRLCGCRFVERVPGVCPGKVYS